jgi:hypothetical protein
VVADETPTDASTVDLDFDATTGVADPQSVTFEAYTKTLGDAYVGVKIYKAS